MSNARARSATACPMRPRPTMPSVLPASCTPMNLLRSHFWARRLASAAATFRDRPSISAKACSAVLSVLPAGVFITTMPRRVAASLSMLAVPTPARTIARRRWLPASDSAVIFTPLRQMAPSCCASASRSSSPLRPVFTSWVMPCDVAASSRARPSGLSVSSTMIEGMRRRSGGGRRRVSPGGRAGSRS